MTEAYIIPGLAKDRFSVDYLISGDERSARKRAEAICVEQSVEFPADLVPPGDIPEHIIGQIEAIDSINPQLTHVRISYLTETTGLELTQLLNVIMGNTSLQPGVRLTGLQLSERILDTFKGPRYGREGLRRYLKINEHRPLLATAIKPMGLSAKELSQIVYQCALGGIDIIKDDHGLANQSFSPYKERVTLCAEAVARANRESGLNCIYMPNVTAQADRIVENAYYAKQAGAGGLLISPALAGFDFMRLLAEDEDLALPIMSHPAFLGSFVVNPDQGFSHAVMFGQITRLAGADISVFPNYGGRFSFSKEECFSIVNGTAQPMGKIKTNLPAPGGGMTLERIPEMAEVYGNDVVYLIGGDLHRHGDLVESSRSFTRLVKRIS